MAAFLNPFVGLTPGRSLTDRELTRALRMALSAEEEAVHLYEALADATAQPLAKAVLQDIANEERVHAGEFQRVLGVLLSDEDDRMNEGAAEVDDLRRQLDAGAGTANPNGAPLSVGTLRPSNGERMGT